MAEEDQCVQSAKISCSANSKNYCYICGKPQSKLARHLNTHKDEVEVAQVLSLLVHSKERKAMLQKLRNKGNFQHNTDVLQCGEGALKIKWHQKESVIQSSLCIACTAKGCLYGEICGII